MKRRIDDLAIFGGTPMFDRIRPIGQLAIGDTRVFFEKAREMYDRRRLTNHGPLVQELEAELAGLHGAKHCICFCSASIAIIAALQHLAKGVSGEIIMPAFTYAGLPHLARWAGLDPLFCDIFPETHTLDPERVKQAITPSTRGILAVHQANSLCRIEELQAVAHAHNLFVLYDSVHALGCSHLGRPIGGFGRAEVFSLHATKIVNGFEGGYITTDDTELKIALSLARNFGFVGRDSISALGLNGKLNEIHAALALSSLEVLPEIIDGNKERYQCYNQAFPKIPGCSIVQYPEGQRSNYEFAILEIKEDWGLDRDSIVKIMRQEGALARPYYSDPLHRSSHMPAGLEVPSLPVTEALSKRFIQMPVGELVTCDDIIHLAKLVAFCREHDEAISQRLSS